MTLTSFRALTPSSFLERSAGIFGDRVAIIDGERTFTYREFHARALALTGVLAARGIRPGDRVAVLCTNSHVMLELHNAVPMRAAVLVSLNIRLTETELDFILEHSGATLLVATHEFAEIARSLSERIGIPLLLADEDGTGDYETELAVAVPAPVVVEDERGLLAINYTSGTTGRPKGVMYHHRGAYLQALAVAFHTGLGPGSAYLWTLPMFHCNGWCFTWGVTAAGGTHVCLRAVDPAEIWVRLRAGVTHFNAAPTVLTMIGEHPSAQAGPLEVTVKVGTGGAAPSPTLIARMTGLNMTVTHMYGLTETYGPVVVNQWQPEWDSLETDGLSAKHARAGVQNVIASPLRVVNADGADVPADGETIGEIVISGNDLMLGYYGDQEATDAATIDGWFRTGDLAVMHTDHYVEIKDRLKDVIISGGENIASVEVESAIDSYPGVVESAVVGASHSKWGEVPVAFVTPRAGVVIESDELIAHLRGRLAGYKIPRRIIIAELPRTSTGKIRKTELRRRLNEEKKQSS